MLFSILDKCINCGYSEMVLTKHTQEIFHNNFENVKLSSHYFEDARSATFFALGQNKVNNKAAILLVDEEEIANIHTGLTESFYQYIPLIVVVLGKKYFKLPYDSFSNISDIINSCDYDKKEINDIMEEYMKNGKKPFIIHVEKHDNDINNLLEEELQYVISIIGKYAENGTLIHSSVNLSDELLEIFMLNKIQYVLRRESYGTLSRFFGYSIKINKVSYLVTTLNNLKKDINTLMIRHINDKTRIIVVEYNNCSGLQSWYKHNGFDYFCCNSKNELKAVLKSTFEKAVIIEYVL